MSPRIVGLFLLLVAGHFVPAPGQNRSPSQTGKAQKTGTQDRQQAPEQVKKMIVSLERRLWDADVASDAAPYSDLIAEDFEGIKHGLLFNVKDDALAAKEYKLRFEPINSP